MIEGARSIPRVLAPSRTAFRRSFELPRTPAVFTGLFDDRPALSTWSLDHLAKNGDLPVRVRISKRGAPQLFGGDMMAAFEFRTVPLREAIDRIQNPGDEIWYVQHGEIPRAPRLAAEIGPLPYLPARLRYRSLLWICGPGTINPLHWDTNHVALLQVRGEKRFVIFPPEDSPKLASLIDRSVWRSTALDLGAIDRARFPDVDRAEAWTCTIGPGDMLFLPYRWWHYMESEQGSISVSWWWAPSLGTLVWDGARETLAEVAKRRLRAQATRRARPG